MKQSRPASIAHAAGQGGDTPRTTLPASSDRPRCEGFISPPGSLAKSRPIAGQEGIPRARLSAGHVVRCPSGILRFFHSCEEE